MIAVFIGVFLLGLTAVLCWPLTVLVHELGHAIPAIILTRQKATIYIGSFGDPRKSLKINLGLLVIYFRYNLFQWQRGLMVPSATDVSTNKQITYVLFGPLASLVVAISFCYLTFTYDSHGFLKLYFIVFFGCAVFDLFWNLIPNPTPILLYDGSITYNDGYTLRELLRLKRLPKGYTTAVELYKQKKYIEAAAVCAKLLEKKKDAHIYRLIIACHHVNRNDIETKKVADAFMLDCELNSNDLCNVGLAYSYNGLHEEALLIYDRSLKMDQKNKYSLYNKGFTLNLLKRFGEARAVLDAAIDVDENYAYPYSERGLSKIKLGFTGEGLIDIARSLEIDPENSYAYRNQGIYHLDKSEFAEALQLFEKAKAIDEKTHQIDYYINYALREMGAPE